MIKTSILQGIWFCTNYQYDRLEGKTPAKACGIKLKGENKLITLTQNASAKINHRVIEE